MKALFRFLIPSLALLLANSLLAQNCGTQNNIGGEIYTDYNFNGLNDEAYAPVEGIVIEAYDALGNLISSTTSNDAGKYVLTVPSGLLVRLEYTNIPEGMTAGYFGADNGTTTQFVTSPNCSIDVGLSSPGCNCDEQPPIMIPCYVNGDPATADARDRAALLTFGYDQRGGGANYATYPPTAGSGGMPNVIADAGSVGALWGVAWDSRSKTAFSSSVVKRFSGFGPLGVGGIYMVSDPSGAAVVSNYIDLAPCTGMTAVARPDLGNGVSATSYDIEAFETAGKAGIGDIEVSEDGLYLYATDLSTKQLVQIKIRNTIGGPIIPGSCANVNSFPIPTVAGCNASDSRPWAIKTYGGKVYVGVVCSGESSGIQSDLTTEIFAFDPLNSVFSPVFGTPQSLDYTTKGCAAGVGAPDDKGFCCEWNTWLGPNDFGVTGPTTNGFTCHPQPLLSDIEFDIDGSIILGFMDRFGLQVGWQNFFEPG